MTRTRVAEAVGLLLWAAALPAQEDLQRGRIKKVDADKGTVTLTVDGKDRDVVLTDRTRVVDANNHDIAEPLKSKALREGAPVRFKVVTRDGKDVLVGLKLAPAGGDIQRGTVKKLDLDRMVLTVTSGGKDRELVLKENTQVLAASGKDLRERLQGFKEGAEILFKPAERDGKEVAVGLKLVGAEDRQPRPLLKKVDTSGLRPLTELGTAEYHGYPGGLYPEGKNERPAAHEAAGERLARQVRPLDRDGRPGPDGKIVLLSVGMSNTSQAWQGFQRILAGDADRNPHLVVVNGAQGGMTAAAIQDPDDHGRGTQYWTTVDDRLRDAGVTRAQVQAVWIKQADAGPTEGFPKYAQKLEGELARIVQLLPRRFPNVKLVYLSSRTYGGYATTPLNPEPYAYESGFSVKWLIERQLKGESDLNFDPGRGPVKAPWLSWGPYLWANGTTKRADGFFWDQADSAPGDGTHESPSGQRKVGELLLHFFKTDPTTRPWFVKS